MQKILQMKESYEVDFPITSSYKILCVDVLVINYLNLKSSWEISKAQSKSRRETEPSDPLHIADEPTQASTATLKMISH